MDLTIGQLIPLPTSQAPANTVPCNGQLLPVLQYGPLAAWLGTAFGGDGVSTFGVPDVPPLTPLNGPPIHWYIATEGIWGGVGAVRFLAQAAPLTGAPPAGTELAFATAPCTGGLQPIDGTSDSFEIFTLMGTQFGGDGVNTFGYPSVPPMPVGGNRSLPYYMATSGVYPSLTCNAVLPSYDGPIALDMFVGTIALFPYLPLQMDKMCGVALCRGQLVEFGAAGVWYNLFSILGTRYGGDGVKTFGLPNLPDGPGGLTYAIVTNGIYPSPD